MNAYTKRLGAIQNVGLLDRCLRVALGILMLGVVLMDLYFQVELGWHVYLAILAVYPLMTGILGVDPFYSIGAFRTCDTSARNRCGTFPFEVEAAMGKKVSCNEGYDCSLSGHHRQATHT